MSAAPTTYYLWRDNAQTGPYTIAQLRGMWQSGTITGDILYWQDGMADWIPLSGISAKLEAQATAPQNVAVTKADPFAHYHTDIQGKKEGRLTVVGGLGIGVGVLFVLFSFHLFSESGSDDSAQQGALYTLLMGVFFIVGCYFWARKK